MAIGDVLGRGGAASPARPASGPRIPVSARRSARRLSADRWASRLVVVGGIVIIASILAILFVIVGEVWPLFRAPTAVLLGRHEPRTGAPATAAGESLDVDEYQELAYRLTTGGTLEFVRLRGAGPVPPPVAVDGLAGASVTTVAAAGKSLSLVGTSDGRAIPVDVPFDVAYPDGKRTVVPRPESKAAIALDPDGRRPIRRLTTAAPPSGRAVVAQVGPSELVTLATVEKKGLVGGGTVEETRGALTVAADGEVTALRLDGRGEDLFVATSRGQLLRYDMRAAPVLADTVTASSAGAAITSLDFLLGDRTLVVGDAAGQVSTWQVTSTPGGADRRLVRIHQFDGHGATVVDIGVSRRDKGFVTVDARGGVRLHYGTSGHTLLVLAGSGGALHGAVIAPKADGIVTVDAAGRTVHYHVDNPHPEVTVRSLFGRLWYEGYDAPAHVWQSTGGTDDFEAKLGLMPLVFGTLKGTIYALLFAVPIALLAALYVSEFMHPSLKATLKPVVEIMAALPSVVLGFLAGLWLAPMVERVVPGLFLLPLAVPVVILATLLGWRLVPLGVRGRLRAGGELILLVPAVLVAAWLAFVMGGFVEAAWLGGSYRGWLQSALGLTYDQRNSLVVGIAMGFAVIPIIFTIAEDSLANVPQHLRAGSLALGANRWQTALRIVLPTASPGIFSAIMIGFGRAVGETMIVLMATGNTPLMDWSVFNGFRALSANIAVELPEAPEGGTLFRVLFLAALLLFGFTFVVNTVAELVRLRLRRRYRYL